jgi:hypothetical protein
MRKSKAFTIEGVEKTFEVRELTTRQIIEFISDDSLTNLGLANMKVILNEKLLPLCTNATWNDLIDLAPSEIEQIWNKFQEVNSTFFVVARAAGLTTVMEEFKRSVMKDFLRAVNIVEEQEIKEQVK